MKEEEIRAKITGRLIEIYGFQRGLDTAQVIIPGILNDFRKMAKDAGPGNTVRETYRVEDRRASISLAGAIDSAGRMRYTELTVE